MARSATDVQLTVEEQAVLEGWVKQPRSEQRLALRGKIILRAAEGAKTEAIAREFGIRTATVSKWRTRFARQGLQGLHDASRSGRRRKYDEETEHRILSTLDMPPPRGETIWTARLVAQELGDVSIHYVWQVLRKHGIHLQRRRSWCVSTDPEFASKAVEIVGLY